MKNAIEELVKWLETKQNLVYPWEVKAKANQLIEEQIESTSFEKHTVYIRDPKGDHEVCEIGRVSGHVVKQLNNVYVFSATEFSKIMNDTQFYAYNDGITDAEKRFNQQNEKYNK